jgi:hypothetical protein
MPTLSELPEIVGFFSYSREDDEDFDHSLSKLRTRIQSELRGQLGRTRETLRLWQDREAIPPGTLWASEIKAAIDQSVFFIPIVSPRVVRSEYCITEFQEFLERERQLGRRDLVFPILFINVRELAEETQHCERPVLKVIAERQYVDWREFRYDPDNPVVRREVADFCAKIVSALQRTPPQGEKEKRQTYEAEQARRREMEDKERRDAERPPHPEVERRGETAEAAARGKEAEARQRPEAVTRTQREAQAEGRAAAAAGAGQHPPPLPSKRSRPIGAVLVGLGIIQCALITTFFIKMIMDGIIFAGIFPTLGLMLFGISTIAVGAGATRRKRWSIPAGLLISVLGLGNGLFWLWPIFAGLRLDVLLLIGAPCAISSVVYLASLLYFLRQPRSGPADDHKIGI